MVETLCPLLHSGGRYADGWGHLHVVAGHLRSNGQRRRREKNPEDVAQATPVEVLEESNEAIEARYPEAENSTTELVQDVPSYNSVLVNSVAGGALPPNNIA